jgi:hypothetical protein
MKEITPVSKKAFVVMAFCEKTKQPYGITVDPIGKNRYKFVWTFKIDKAKAKREHFDKTSVHGEIENDENYPGCPYCGHDGHFFCSCGAIVCNDSDYGYCPNCGWRGELYTATEFDLTGGGY